MRKEVVDENKCLKCSYLSKRVRLDEKSSAFSVMKVKFLPWISRERLLLAPRYILVPCDRSRFNPIVAILIVLLFHDEILFSLIQLHPCNGTKFVPSCGHGGGDGA